MNAERLNGNLEWHRSLWTVCASCLSDVEGYLRLEY